MTTKRQKNLKNSPISTLPSISRRLVWIAATVIAVLLVFGYTLSARWTQAPVDRVIDFQDYRFGVPPAEFEYDATGPHGPTLSEGQPFWRTYVDKYAPSPGFTLVQAATLDKLDHYPIAILKDVKALDLNLSLYFKIMGGNLAQSAGMIWRVQDKNNYYAALANAFDNQLHIYKMVDGKPFEISTAPIDLKVTFEQKDPLPNQGWYSLRLQIQQDQMIFWYGAQSIIQMSDKTFMQPGGVGLITHADTVALFDDIHIRAGDVKTTATSRPTATPLVPPTMHIADINVTDAEFKTPVDAVTRGKDFYGRVVVVDEKNSPVPAAMVKLDILRPDGSLLANKEVMTGVEGIALIIQQLPESEPTGIYRIEIRGVTNADISEATYNANANTTSAISFQVE